MTANRRVERFTRGQPLSALRPQLNALVDRVNYDATPAGSVGASPGFLAQTVLYLQIKILNASTLTCVLPGQVLNPSAEEWTVELPLTFTEAARSGVNYVYSDINTRVADGTENQELTPIYLINDLIVAADLEEGSNWRDLNIDGRQWAKVP